MMLRAATAAISLGGECTMLKKAKADSAAARGGQARDVAQAVLDSSHQIWLAGLGAFARRSRKARRCSRRSSKQGERLETPDGKRPPPTPRPPRAAPRRAKAKEMQQMAGGTWDKLEQVFEDRVERALSKLGVLYAERRPEAGRARRRACRRGEQVVEGENVGSTKAAAARAKAPAKAPAKKAPAKTGHRRRNRRAKKAPSP